MKDRIINTFFILILICQMLPVKQIVSYLLNDDETKTEEVADLNKGTKKLFKFSEETDKWIFMHQLSLRAVNVKTSLFHSFEENIFSSHCKEVQTPPPNKA